jgi:phosphoribosylformylglycinamidine cyclo-ligase
VNRLTYRAAGVDIEAGDEAVRRIAPLARATFRPEVLGGIGGFAGFVQVPAGYREPVLVSSTDGVGTKLKVAFMADRHDSVGIDLVAMGVNDLLVHGAEPLYFLDYIGIARLEPAVVEALVRGVAEGCRQAGCALIGGETAELPGLYALGEYDLAGFAVGIVERARIIDGSAVKTGDVGYSLARRIIFDVLKLGLDATLPGTGRSVAEVLLEPTRIYVRSVLPVRERVHAMAHVTGGGITGNLPRVLPEGCRALIQRRAWSVPPVFATLGDAGHVAEAGMFRTFNMGIGYLLVVPSANAGEVIAELTAAGESVHALGEITAGERGVELV